ncbi:hypothetical protein [Gottfriedia acidiceleris]|uniref:Uncharacterized protein n=1 Tax=Gottfriedia acidiceleris TaxID=371036 RepID=A0ABY4JH79_9BACI|nr:hypothetical protein [Gottfriedia acidiceleris]UPM52434.1 hypothetical protein MY490_11315 [Gottfriedia acidiceleris]
MRNFIKFFLQLLEDLKSEHTLQDWEENYTNVKFTLNSNYGYFKNLFSKAPYDEELTKDRISFTFLVNDQDPINNNEFHEWNFFTEEQNTKLTIALNKEECFGLEKNEILFFSKKSFIKHFNIDRKDTASFLKQINHEKFVHIYLPIEKSFENNFLKILPIQKYPSSPVIVLEPDTYEIIKLVQKKREEYTRVEAFYPLPTFFSIEIIDKEIQNMFNRNLFFLCLIHITNKHSNDIFLIRGQKNIELTYSVGFTPQYAKILHNIYESIYKLEKFVQDKLEIVRNIFSIYCQSEDNVQSLDEQLVKVEETVNQYFNAYISDEVKSFLKETKEAIDVAHKHATVAREAADKIINNINTSIIAMITAAVAAVVTMSKGEYWFLILALGVHLVYFYVSYKYNAVFTRQKKNDILSLYEITNEQFPVVSKKKREEIKVKFLDPAIQNIEVNLLSYKKLTIYLVIFTSILLIVLLFFGNFASSNEEKKQQNIVKLYANEFGDIKNHVNR